MTEVYKQPAYRIAVDGVDTTAAIQDRLISLSLTDNRGFEADQIDIVLDDSDGKLDLPPRGATVHISIGWQDSGVVDKGSYTVDEISHSGAPDTMTIRARSADVCAGLSAQHERSWHYALLRDIVQTIADENQLVPLISTQLSGQFVDHIDQSNESSANLLTRLARMFDAIATVKNGRLLFIPAGAGISASGKPLPGVVINRESGDSHHFSIADRDTYTRVKASYYDTHLGLKGDEYFGKPEDDAEHNRAAQKAAAAATPVGAYKQIKVVSKSRAAALRVAHKEWKRVVGSKVEHAKYIGVTVRYNDRNLHVQGEVSYGDADVQHAQQNAAKLAKKDAAKIHAQPPVVAIDYSQDNLKVLRHVYASKENAHRAARAEWRKLQRGMAEFSITMAQGRAELIPETPATVQGFKISIDNTDWIIAKVIHNLNDRGYTTQIELEIKATELPG